MASVDGQTVNLTPREFDLLVFLMRNPGQAFTRDLLLPRSGAGTSVTTSTVTVHVRRLREKVEADPSRPAAS